MTNEDHRAQDGSPDLMAYGPVLTPEEVAQVLRLNQQHLVRLMRQGKFPAFKVAGAWRVRRSALEAVMDGTWQPPDAGAADHDE
ncbi:helix-turn-helix domain-containing protein [uncultured Cellulomonas sp.]|uniref:helix-turn-helix domain-containing protein n=1 Tax=uncultured Cellulomonas sp. TaxID=189682 RepID=UPI002632A9DB|nr:helix-turn-helix domain-containing protein [uncultured Cellulomonas sp.]